MSAETTMCPTRMSTAHTKSCQETGHPSGPYLCLPHKCAPSMPETAQAGCTPATIVTSCFSSVVKLTSFGACAVRSQHGKGRSHMTCTWIKLCRAYIQISSSSECPAFQPLRNEERPYFQSFCSQVDWPRTFRAEVHRWQRGNSRPRQMTSSNNLTPVWCTFPDSGDSKIDRVFMTEPLLTFMFDSTNIH